MLGLALCLLSSVFSKVADKGDNGVSLPPDRSLTSVSFWNEVVKDVIESSK